MPVQDSSAKSRSLLAVALMALTGLTGCISPVAGPDGLYARPIGDAPVTENPTPYSEALICLGRYAEDHHIDPPHIAVGSLRDLTGQLDSNGGRPVTQGAMLMAISALGKAGIPLVERYETDVPKLEFDLANNKLISDEKGPPRPHRDYRPIYPGEVTGSDYFLAGGITELNSSIRSSNASANLVQAGRSSSQATASPSISAYVMNVGLDLRLVNTTSLDIADIVSYQKQIVGYQVGTGLFAFFGDQILSVNGATNAEEPVQLAVRSLIERAMVQFVSRLYHVPQNLCMRADPLAGADRRITRPVVADGTPSHPLPAEPTPVANPSSSAPPSPALRTPVAVAPAPAITPAAPMQTRVSVPSWNIVPPKQAQFSPAPAGVVAPAPRPALSAPPPLRMQSPANADTASAAPLTPSFANWQIAQSPETAWNAAPRIKDANPSTPLRGVSENLPAPQPQGPHVPSADSGSWIER